MIAPTVLISLSVVTFGVGFALFVKGFKFLATFNSRTVPTLLNDLEQSVRSEKELHQKDSSELAQLRTLLSDHQRLKEEAAKFKVSFERAATSLEDTLKKVSLLEQDNVDLRSQSSRQETILKNRISQAQQELEKSYSGRIEALNKALAEERQKSQKAAADIEELQREKKAFQEKIAAEASQKNSQASEEAHKIIDALKKENASLKEEIKESGGVHAAQEAAQAIAALNKEKEDNRARYAQSLLELRDANKKLSDQLKELQEQRQGMVSKSALQEKDAAIEALQKKSNALEQLQQRLSQEKEQGEKALFALKEENAQLIVLKDKCKALTEELDERKNSADKAFLRLQESQEEAAALKKGREKQLDEGTQLQSSLRHAQAETAKLKAETEKLQAEASKSLAEISKLQAENTQLQSSLREVQQVSVQLKDELEALQKENKQLQFHQQDKKTVDALQEEIRELRIKNKQQEDLVLQAEEVRKQNSQLLLEREREEAALRRRQQELDSLREANILIRQTHERNLEDMKLLAEKMSGLEGQYQQVLSEKNAEAQKTAQEIALLRKENEALKTDETKKFLRMKKVSSEFQAHMETFEQERYELQRSIEELRAKLEDALSQEKDSKKNEFLALEQRKELERLLNKKTKEHDELLQEKVLLIKENEAFKKKDAENGEGSIRARLKNVVKDLKEFSDRLAKDKKDLAAQIEKLEKNIVTKEKELYEKETDIEGFKEQLKLLQEELKQKQRQAFRSQDAQAAGQDLSSQTEQFLLLKSEAGNLRALLESARKEKDMIADEHKKQEGQIGQLKKTLEQQKSELNALRAKQEEKPQDSNLVDNERSMLEWYRSIFDIRNRELKNAKLANLGLKEEVEILREELRRYKRGDRGTHLDDQEEVRA